MISKKENKVPWAKLNDTKVCRAKALVVSVDIDDTESGNVRYLCNNFSIVDHVDTDDEDENKDWGNQDSIVRPKYCNVCEPKFGCVSRIFIKNSSIVSIPNVTPVGTIVE